MPSAAMPAPLIEATPDVAQQFALLFDPLRRMLQPVRQPVELLLLLRQHIRGKA